MYLGKMTTLEVKMAFEKDPGAAFQRVEVLNIFR